MINLMLLPFVACMLLVAIHGYFGLHVIARGVIFVDLALAQMAALGATTGLLFRISPESNVAHAFAIGATVTGAAILAATRSKKKTRVPQEAIIGIVYVVASAAAMVIADKAPRGTELIKDSLIGAILWVSWPIIIKDAVAYAFIGLALFLLRRKFEAISFDPEAARASGMHVRWWDFVFYALFGLTVTFSVPIAGVLLVFTFLVVPAVTAFLFFVPPAPLMPIVAWGTGMVACTIGLVVSYVIDLPTGPVIVCTFGLVLLLAWILKLALGLRPAGAAAGERGTA
jgi:zinc/manganese transport system permease protein